MPYYRLGRCNRRRRRLWEPETLGNFRPSWGAPRIEGRGRNRFGRFLRFGNPPGCGINIFRYGNRNINNQGNFNQENQNQGVAEPDPQVVLTVRNVDLKINENAKAHHTDQYHLCSPWNREAQLIVRRGQPFNIDIDFSKEYDEKNDDLRLLFEAGEDPLESKGTAVEFILSDEDKPKEWGAKILSKKGNTLSIQVFTPPTCFVGAWDLSVEVIKKDDKDVNVYSYEHEDPIYIIFNPMCKDDSVFMSDESKRKEYIFNETGYIYSGSHNNITRKPWNFGQFERNVFDAVMHLLEISELNWAVRGNPVAVVRKISALVNSQDEGGVLVGNWTSNYRGGRSPLSWLGSAAILQEYYRTKTPVKFGQCWVFSGISTTVCRALGIPCRSVTNFESAHDTDGSITIDLHFTSDGAEDKGKDSDSIWNFHVWNEAWMARNDLPSGYGGWQAFDATPQEASDDVYCCGPVSVQAIKQGEVNLPFDGPFVFAEVNADRCHWSPDDVGRLKCHYIDQNAVGKFISTKAANSYEREDITNNYKPEEGSADERAAVLKANQVGSSRRDIYKKQPSDVKFRIEQDSERTWVGGNFELTLHMKNNSSANRKVSGRVVVKTMYYTGVVADNVYDGPFKDMQLKPGQDTSHKVTVKPEDYIGKLKDCCMLDVSVWAVVDETSQHFTLKEDFRLRKPHLTVKAPKEGIANKEFKAEVSFSNPLNTALTQCYVVVDGLSEEIKFPQGNVGPKGTFTVTLPITPQKLGQRDLIIIFNSEQLEDINALHAINIKGA